MLESLTLANIAFYRIASESLIARTNIITNKLLKSIDPKMIHQLNLEESADYAWIRRNDHQILLNTFSDIYYCNHFPERLSQLPKTI